jgi:hypothetical protein
VLFLETGERLKDGKRPAHPQSEGGIAGCGTYTKAGFRARRSDISHIEQLGEASDALQYAEASHCDWMAVAGGSTGY